MGDKRTHQIWCRWVQDAPKDWESCSYCHDYLGETMGAKAGRKRARFYKIRTYGVKQWRHYRDKCRRKSAKKEALDEEMEAWQQAGAEAYWKVEEEVDKNE